MGQPKLIHASELHTLPPCELLPDTHLVARGFNVVFGPSGSYKSFYVLAQALTVAQTQPVVYVAAEGSTGFDNRVKSWCAHNQKEPGELYFICEEVNLLDAGSLTSLIKAIHSKTKKSELLIFDTYARCMIGGDENSARDTGLVIQYCAAIQRKLQTAVCLVHHTNRAERGERGSGALRGGADAMIETSKSDDGVLRVICSKVKDGSDWPDEYYRFWPVDKSGLLLPAHSVPSDRQIGPYSAQILELLAFEIFRKPGAKSQQIKSTLNLSERTVYRALSELKKLCLIRQAAKGDPFCLTDLGRSTLLSLLPESHPLRKSLEEEDIQIELPDCQPLPN